MLDKGAALRLAINHLDHMARWIGDRKAGYSFEALGEDMPDIKAALSADETRVRELTDALRAARPWIESAVAPIRNLSPTAAEPGESVLRKIDAALKGV